MKDFIQIFYVKLKNLKSVKGWLRYSHKTFGKNQNLPKFKDTGVLLYCCANGYNATFPVIIKCHACAVGMEFCF